MPVTAVLGARNDRYMVVTGALCPGNYRLSKKKGYKLKTLNEGLPLEDSSDFDDFYTELIVMTRSFI